MVTHNLLVNSNIQGIPFTIRRALDSHFHTGALGWDYLYTEANYPNVNGLIFWEPVKPYLTYAEIQGNITLNSDGSLTPNPPDLSWLDVTWDGIVRQLTAIFNAGDIPVLEMWLTNFESVTEPGLTIFLKKLSEFVGPRIILWTPAWEMNYELGYAGWGNRGDGRTWRIEAADYNRQMALMRKVLDDNDIKNVLLSCHGNLRTGLAGLSGIQEYFPGMLKADIIGFSHYETNLAQGWARASQIYAAMNTSKPFIFLEYGPHSVWQTGTNVTVQEVNDSYNLLRTYPFVKGFIFYFGTDYATPEVALAIRDNILIYG